MSEKEKLITAYHEGGHALVAAALPGHRPGAQGHDPAARPGARLHDGAARRGQVLPDPLARCSTSSPTCSAAGPPRRWSSTTRPPAPATTSRRPPRWPGRWSPQYGMTERLGAIKLGETQRRAVPGPRHRAHRATTPRTSPRSSTRRPRSSSRPPTRRPSTSSRRTATSSTRWCSSCWRRRPSTRREVAEVFEPLRRRPARPAWTGSPDREPSTIPPVEIPQEIRDRAAANGAGPTAEAGAIAHAARRRAATSTAARSAAGRRHPEPDLPRDDRPDRPRPSAPRATIPPFDHDRAAAAVRELLIAIGEDPEREGLRETPARVARAYAELTAGLRHDARGRAHHDLRPRPRRDGAGPRHRAVVDVRAPPGAVHRRRPRRLHPGRERQDHRAVQAGPAGRRLRQAPAGAGAADHPGRRRADGDPRGRAA